jgi:uncharacterized membrane protein YagU involved in acid resistance
MRVINLLAVIGTGFWATLIMTWLAYWLKGIGLPKIDYAQWHAAQILPEGMEKGIGGWICGQVSHFLVGVVFALAYALWFAPNIALPGWLLGIIFGAIFWAVVEIIYLPVVERAGVLGLGRSKLLWLTDLICRIVWGLILGAAYKVPTT